MTDANQNSAKNSTITSKDNPLFKKLKLLLSAKGIKEHNLFFLMGQKLIKEFTQTKNKKFKVHFVVTSPKYTAKFPFTTIELSQELFNELDTLGTHYPLFVLECEDFEILNLEAEPSEVEILLPLGDPRNMGSVCRSALAFGLKKIILTSEACHPLLPHAVKSSAGAVLKMNFYMTKKSLPDSEITGINYALDLKGENLRNLKWPPKFRLWLGEEGPGLNLNPDQKKQMKFITLPTQEVESLNAAVSASITFWEISKSHKI